MNTGQHRRAAAPLRDQIVKLVAASSGNHRRRKSTQPSDQTASTAEEQGHATYQTEVTRKAS